MNDESWQTRKSITRMIPAALLILSAALMLSTTAHAVAPKPSVIDSLRAEGELDAYLALRRDAAARGVCAPVELSRVPTRNLAASGMAINYHIPCILVDFSDNPASGGLVNTTPQMMYDKLFTTGVNPDGSFKEYYNEISYGQMNVIGTVVGWYRMPNTYAYYMDGQGGIGNYPRNSQKLCEDAVFAASGDLNFSEFDNSPIDGFVDGVMIVVPGSGGEETGDLNEIHSHKFAVPAPYPSYNGKSIRDYTVQPEESATSSHGPQNPVGVYCHEWGHILGLPDLYDLDDCDSLEICGDLLSSGLGSWSLMALGNWLPNYDSYLPAHPDAWCRIHMGFATETKILTNQVDYPIPAVESTPTIIRLWEGGATQAEYFLVENRWKTGFDAAIPGQGLLIYHVDDNNNSNRNQWIEGADPPSALHYWVALEQADGLFSLEKYDGSGNAGDPYASDSVGIDHLSYPSTNRYSGASSQVAVWNISPAAATMTANLDVFYSRPLLEAANFGVADPAGDGDGLPEAGETFELTFDLNNYMKDASNVQVVVSAPNSDLIFVDDTYELASLASDATVRNTLDPITITVPDQYRSRNVNFIFDITAEGGTYHWTEEQQVAIGPPRFLIVDDDRGGTSDRKLTATLDSLNELYTVWDVSTQGDPSGATLGGYPVVFWMTGDSNSTSPTTAGVSAMQSYLDAGGHLFLTGQDIAENISERADAGFLADYLGIEFTGNEKYPLMSGVSGDVIGDGLTMNGGSTDGAKNQKSPDQLGLASGTIASALAVPCYTYYWQSGLTAGVHVDNNYRVVFFGFGFEAISNYSVAQGFNTREQVLQPIINWLDPDLATGVFDDPGSDFTGAGVPRGYDLAQNYPNPFNAATVIPFTLTGAQHVRLDVFDILGRRVQTLKDEQLEPGVYQVTWNGTDRHGESVSSGVYFYRLTIAGKSALAKQMVLLK